jgi:site-specific recombinase XerD
MVSPKSKVTKVKLEGPLAPFVDLYRSRLKERGYTPLSIVNELRQLAHLSRWLEERQMTEADLSRERLIQFLDLRRERFDHRACSLQGLTPLLEILDEQRVERPDGDPTSASTRDVLLSSFEKFLLHERGLVPSTASSYVLRARRFLTWFAPSGDLANLCARDVTDAVLRESATLSVGAAQLFVVALRSFLRFCFIEGLTATDLSAAALSLTGRRHSPLPKGISKGDADALLRSCDKRRSMGRRDFAILLVLLRLGLRAGEVAGLRLDDIDWRAGEIVVRGKGRREDRLPLPSDVGDAIASYLRKGRPKSTDREVFLRALAPVGPLGRGGISTAVRRACKRVSLPPVGAHRLRHTLACEMVRAGVPLPEIAQALRHRGISSSSIYARVDIDRLRVLAQPWPGA